MRKINITITGYKGRMGRQLIKSIAKLKKYKLVSITETKKLEKKIFKFKTTI